MKENYLEEGQKFKQLLKEKGLSGQKFSMLALYSQSRIYEFFTGESDMRTLSVYNAVIFARLLGFETVDEFYKACGIDLLKELG